MTFWRDERVVWWFDGHGARRYHELPPPAGLEYARLMPSLTYGTPEEAEATGRTPCMGSPTCREKRAERLSGKRSRWQRGRPVRR